MDKELERIHEGLTRCVPVTRHFYRTPVQAFREDKLDPTPVPPHYQRVLERLAFKNGYPVKYEVAPEGDRAHGVTNLLQATDIWGQEHILYRDIVIDSRMSPASKFRVTCHELTHVWLHQKYGRTMGYHYFGEHEHELIAEAAAAIVCAKMRLDSGGRFSLRYLAEHGASTRDLERTRPYAVRAAEWMIKALEKSRGTN